MTKTRNYLYKVILLFAIADFALGVTSMCVDDFGVQLSAFVVTSITLALSITFAIKYPRKKRADIVMIVVGSLDFVTTLISLLVIVMATQLLALLASGFTLLKAVKIFVQSEKAKKLFDTTKPILLKLAQRCAPAFGAWLVSKTNYIKQKLEGDKVMQKVKEFIVKLGQLIRANKVSLGETVINGGAWAALGVLVNYVDQVAIDVCGFNITPLFTVLGFAVIELGFLWEPFGDFIKRIAPKLEAKEAKKAEKEKAAQEAKELEERARILAEIKAEKEKAEAEAKAKLEAEAKAKLEAEEKLKKEQEEKAKKEAEDKEIAEWLAKKEAEAKAAEATTTVQG